MQYHQAEKFITELLQSKLSPLLFYHNYFHTMDVMNAAAELARDEKITDENDLTLLKTAALFHDSGFVYRYENNEEEGCRVVKEILPGFGYSDEQIMVICKMIMKTKMPQQPETHLEKILCDADLDYLGRDEYESGGDKLYREWNERGKAISEKEWIELQIKFLESHSYWTQSAKAKRGKKKSEHLQKLKEKYLILYPDMA